MLSQDKNCIVCSKENSKNLCSKCNLIRYCSVECQTIHWKTHKDVCKKLDKRIIDKKMMKSSDIYKFVNNTRVDYIVIYTHYYIYKFNADYLKSIILRILILEEDSNFKILCGIGNRKELDEKTNESVNIMMHDVNGLYVEYWHKKDDKHEVINTVRLLSKDLLDKCDNNQMMFVINQAWKGEEKLKSLLLIANGS